MGKLNSRINEWKARLRARKTCLLKSDCIILTHLLIIERATILQTLTNQMQEESPQIKHVSKCKPKQTLLFWWLTNFFLYWGGYTILLTIYQQILLWVSEQRSNRTVSWSSHLLYSEIHQTTTDCKRLKQLSEASQRPTAKDLPPRDLREVFQFHPATICKGLSRIMSVITFPITPIKIIPLKMIPVIKPISTGMICDNYLTSTVNDAHK